MRAAVLEELGAPLVVRGDVEIAEPRRGEVLVRVHHCGVCHSDLSVMDGGFPLPTPIVLGHEAAGVVAAVGAEVRSVVVGDRVVLTPNPPCGRCPGCLRGEPGTCTLGSGMMITASLADGETGLRRDGEVVYRGLGVGAFAEYALAAELGVVRIDDEVPLEVACVLGCGVQTGVGAVLNTAKVVPGSSVLVTGLGGVGLSVLQGARVAGAARIVVSDPVAERREAAMALGATDAVDPLASDLVTAVRDLTAGEGADYAFEAAGRAALVRTCVDATRAGGTTVIVGAPPIAEELQLGSAVLFGSFEKKLLGCMLGSSNSLRDIPRLLALAAAGRLELGALITARRPLDDIGLAVDDLRAARGIRTVIDLI